MQFSGTIVSALETHSDLITAVATVVLVVVTVLYVRASYQLVSHQRLQLESPEVVGSFVGDPFPDIRLQNVGNGTATELTILAGPGEGVAAHIPMLGQREALLPGGDHVWEVRPTGAAVDFEPGDLTLTILYFNNNLTTLYFKVMVLRFEGASTVRHLGFVPGSFTKRELRRQARRESLKPWRRLSYQWRTRKPSLTQLILEEETRAPLRCYLEEQVELLVRFHPKMEEIRRTV